jgi:hypothetical protein
MQAASPYVVIPAKAGIQEFRQAALVHVEERQRQPRHGLGARGFRLSPE